ncbi:MAG: acetoacetate--CoA ligase [Bacteroidota bacterium]
MIPENSPELLWQPSEVAKKNANISHFMTWLYNTKALSFSDYQTLWQWSIDNLSDFWKATLEYFNVMYDGEYETVLDGSEMPGINWFPGIRLNYSEHVFRSKNDEYPAIIFKSESSKIKEVSWDELEKKVAAFQSYLTANGVKEGDRVAAYLPNIPEAIIAFLAVNALGAIWSSTSPDFGTSSVVDRITQIEPVLLIAVGNYNYGGKQFKRIDAINEIVEAIPSIKTLVLLESEGAEFRSDIKKVTWKEAISNRDEKLIFNRVEFNHPIWILYSSGTTGIPKAITQSHGGILLEHLKYLGFHNNIKPGDRCFWYTTTGWMMWNYIQASMLCGGTVVLYDGSPAYPDMNVLWQFAQDAEITHFGTSAGFVVANMKAETHPGSDFDLSSLQSIGSTGSPLPPEGFDWIYKEVKEDLWLASISGGTDVCSAFVGGNPLWPVYEGEIQCRALGCALEAYDEAGKSIEGEMGEMVITKPMPSMPIYLWGDKGFSRYRDSYFDLYPGVWRHGDWTEITARQGIIIYGRSDSTLNRGGIRIGTAEIYRAVDTIPEIADSMVVYLDKSEKEEMPLFVKIKEGHQLTEDLIQKIKATIRNSFTPRHVPDKIIEVDEIPYTISGKKMETPVKRILMGMDAGKVINKDAMRNPEALNFFLNFADRSN